jgi:uncharacterized MAPEG superfamily protein
MNAFAAVLLYATWTLLLPIFYAGTIRVPAIARGRKRADNWERGRNNEDPPLFVRAKNAHANCIENFPIFAAVVVIAALLGKIAIADSLAAYVLYARLAQSIVHISGTSLPLIALRGAFYFVQIVLILYMIWRLLLG